MANSADPRPVALELGDGAHKKLDHVLEQLSQYPTAVVRATYPQSKQGQSVLANLKGLLPSIEVRNAQDDSVVYSKSIAHQFAEDNGRYFRGDAATNPLNGPVAQPGSELVLDLPRVVSIDSILGVVGHIPTVVLTLSQEAPMRVKWNDRDMRNKYGELTAEEWEQVLAKQEAEREEARKAQAAQEAREQAGELIGLLGETAGLEARLLLENEAAECFLRELPGRVREATAQVRPKTSVDLFVFSVLFVAIGMVLVAMAGFFSTLAVDLTATALGDLLLAVIGAAAGVAALLSYLITRTLSRRGVVVRRARVAAEIAQLEARVKAWIASLQADVDVVQAESDTVRQWLEECVSELSEAERGEWLQRALSRQSEAKAEGAASHGRLQDEAAGNRALASRAGEATANDEDGIGRWQPLAALRERLADLRRATSELEDEARATRSAILAKKAADEASAARLRQLLMDAALSADYSRPDWELVPDLQARRAIDRTVAWMKKSVPNLEIRETGTGTVLFTQRLLDEYVLQNRALDPNQLSPEDLQALLRSGEVSFGEE